ncbi:MAG: single-stranded DNA-binding protein [Oscillospiraceae bacterium]|nr:single-stranded DNA-binding protein [Oscillospiraceae bacterium]
MEGTYNSVELRGVMAGAPRFSHRGGGSDYYTFPLDVVRLSGTADTINIIARRDILDAEPGEGDKVYIRGELRSFNNRSGVGHRLVITVLARELRTEFGDFLNSVELTGTICREPIVRRTPMGREICDLMLAVNRRYGRSDYLPVICWGMTAKQTAMLPVRTRVRLSGRIQSRKYLKAEGDELIEKTAFEVSAVQLQTVEDDGLGRIAEPIGPYPAN